jgi:hypothetical protein
MVYFMHVAIVAITLLPLGVEFIVSEEHGKRLSDPTAEVHVDGDVGAFLSLREVSPATVVDSLASVDVEPFASVETDRVVWVRLHKVDLFL